MWVVLAQHLLRYALAMPNVLRRLLEARALFTQQWVHHLLQSNSMWDRLGVYPPFLFFGIPP